MPEEIRFKSESTQSREAIATYLRSVADKLDSGGEISDVTGQGIFDAETPDKVADEIERLSEGTMDRVTDEDL